MYAAIDSLVDKLDRQIIKHKEKHLDQRHDAALLKPRTGNDATAAQQPGLNVAATPAPYQINSCHEPDRQAAAARERRCSTSTSASKKRVFEQVGLLFENNHSIARSQVFDSLFAREKLGSTGLGQGVAIPHGRIKGLQGSGRRDGPHAASRSRSTRRTARPVSLIFVLLVPERATDLHLQILSELAQMFSDKPFRERLLGAPERRRSCTN